MKFTLLTTAFVTAAAMARRSYRIRRPSSPQSGPLVQGTPEKATHPDATKFYDKPDTFGCSKGIEGYNEGNDFGYTCASKWQFKSLMECTCKDCCRLIEDGKKPYCPEKKKVTPDKAKLCDKAGRWEDLLLYRERDSQVKNPPQCLVRVADVLAFATLKQLACFFNPLVIGVQLQHRNHKQCELLLR
ncbi:hypothetical protein DFJ58DRAFT_846303 [Suillus subalutaceus]|uniref:uncharacterized protein n=1 Tax=Suillus subalutaceus TaxID=48586 RepID=UPI001B885DA4|nr:uncharacterized protein DFJ58DRAFT_846303 [Suillus subalutaceus]KAG1837849.1 hypothetical protein DFJ58DRAFT_846303 [Suillus subalutaceus]